MNASSPDTKEPKIVSRKKFLLHTSLAAVAVSTVPMALFEATSPKNSSVLPASSEPKPEEEKIETTEERIFKNFSHEEKAAFEEKAAKQKNNYERADDPLRAERVLNWEVTTLEPILDLDVPEKDRQFWKEFLSAIVYVESEGKNYVISDVDAIGLTQLTKATAKDAANKHGLFDFNLAIGWDNLRISRFHLQDLVERFGVDLSVLAYYAGFTFANQKVLQALEKHGINLKEANDQKLHSYTDQYKINIANIGSEDGEEYLKKVVAALRILEERRKTTLQTKA